MSTSSVEEKKKSKNVFDKIAKKTNKIVTSVGESFDSLGDKMKNGGDKNKTAPTSTDPDPAPAPATTTHVQFASVPQDAEKKRHLVMKSLPPPPQSYADEDDDDDDDDDKPASSSSSSGGSLFSSFLGHLISDKTILLVALARAMHITLSNRELIYQSKSETGNDYMMIPLRITAPWLVLAFLGGHSFSARHFFSSFKGGNDVVSDTSTSSTSSNTATPSSILKTDKNTTNSTSSGNVQFALDSKRHSLVSMAVKSFRSTSKITPIPTTTESKKYPSGFWSVLDVDTFSSDFKIWQVKFTSMNNQYIQDRMNRLPGGYQKSIMKAIGFDMFKTELPDAKIYTNAYLKQAGLRDRPLFIINAMNAFGNNILYFEMPSWVKKFGDIKVEDGDSDDVIAFKNFLTGTDKYRGDRFKFFLSLKEGPGAVTFIFSPKREFTMTQDDMPLKWYQEDEYIAADGVTKRHAVLEVDLIQTENNTALSKTIMKLAKKHMPSVVVDAALTISVEDKGKKIVQNEPWACLSTFSIHKLDVTKAAIIPEPDDDVLLKQTMKMMPLSAEQLSELSDGVDFDE